MKDLLGVNISENMRGIIYFCDFNYVNNTVKILLALKMSSVAVAIDFYDDLGQSSYQLAVGDTYEELCDSLTALHRNLKNPRWIQHQQYYK